MVKRVRGSDGLIVEFPDDTDEATINSVMAQRHTEFEARQAAGNRQMGAQPTRRRNWPRSNNPQGRRDLGGLNADNRAYLSARVRRAEQQDFGGQNAPEGSLERGLNDFRNNTDFNSQMWRNLGVGDEIAAATTWLGQAGENLVRRAQGQPIEIPANTAAQAALGYERDEQRRVEREQPILNAASIAASVPAFAGPPVMNAPRMNMFQAGGSAMALNAPFAVGRQEGTLQERLPGAAVETAVVGGTGAGLQGLANRFLSQPAANSASLRAAEFEQAGVRPTLAAVQGGPAAGASRVISENFLAGAPARARMQASLDDTASAARNLSSQYGQHGQPEQVGEAVQRGVQRFAQDRDVPAPTNQAPEAIPTREWSFRAKAEALYNRVFRRIEEDEVQHLAGQTGARASAQATQQALEAIQGRVSAPNVAEIVNDPLIARISNAMAQDADNLRFQDLRALRTWVREAQARPALTQTIDNAALQRLERALTEDIYTSAMQIGGQSAAQQLRRADQFYRAGQNRINGALQAFDPNRTGGAQAYQRIIALAREGGRQNTRQLQSLRNSLQSAEWREVAATIIDDLGRPTPGNPAALQPGAFSVEQFVTNYARLSQEGRRILFGGSSTDELASALDNLARVAGYQKGVEALANRSRSGVNVQNVGVAAGLLNPGTFGSTAALLATMTLTGEMLTNPAFVRWLVSAAKSGGGPGGIRLQLGGLATLAARDPALAPLYTELVQRVGDRSQAPAAQQPERTAPLP